MELLKKIVENSGLDVHFTMKEFLEGSGNGVYFLDSNSIEIGVNSLEYSCRELKKTYNIEFSEEELGEMIVSHELGHAKDTELPEIRQISDELCVRIKHAACNSDVFKIKEPYKVLSSLVMKKETTAWDLAPSFFLNDIDKEKLRVYREHCLDSYRSTLKTEFKYYIVMCKLFSRLNKYNVPFLPKDISFTADFSNAYSSKYDEETNTYFIHLPNLLRWRGKKFKQFSTVDFLLLQSMYEFVSAKYQDEDKKVYEYNSEAYTCAFRGEDRDSLFLNLNLFKAKYLELKNRILNEMETGLGSHPKFELFRSIIIKSVEEDIQDSYDFCEDKFNKKCNEKKSA